MCHGEFDSGFNKKFKEICTILRTFVTKNTDYDEVCCKAGVYLMLRYVGGAPRIKRLIRQVASVYYPYRYQPAIWRIRQEEVVR